MMTKLYFKRWGNASALPKLRKLFYASSLLNLEFMRKKLIAASALLVLVCVSGIWAQNKSIGTFPFEAKRGPHTARVVLRTVPFDRTKHKVVINRRNETIIDGRPAFGTDGNVPSVEIASIRLYFDGKEIRVPRRLYADCYEPNPEPLYFRVKVSRDAKAVIVEMSGSDAAAAYTVTWRLRRNGRHTRSAYQHFSAEDTNP